MFSYLTQHWRGQHSLVRSYWINGVVAGFIVRILYELSLSYLDHENASIMLTIYNDIVWQVVFWILIIWFTVGCLRSARNHVRLTARRFWAVCAALACVLGLVASVVRSTADVSLLRQVWRELAHPDLADYQVSMLGDTDIRLDGALSDEARRGDQRRGNARNELPRDGTQRAGLPNPPA